MTATILVQGGTVATQLMAAGEGSAFISNTDTANPIWCGDDNSIQAGDLNHTVEISPGGYVTLDGSADFFAIANAGQTVAVAKVSSATGFFAPPNLAGIGGVSAFVQGTAPTGVIAPNSIWFNTTSKSIETWSGTAWVTQSFDAAQLINAATILGSLIAANTASFMYAQTTAPVSPKYHDMWFNTTTGQLLTFNGSTWDARQFGAAGIANGSLTTTQIAAAAGILGGQIAAATVTSANIAAHTIVAGNIAANTITAAQLAAGIVYAGIVDATTVNGVTITGSVFKGTNWIENASGSYFYSGTPAAGNLIASVASADGTDSFANAVLAIMSVYGSAGQRVSMDVESGLAQLQLATGDSAEATAGVASTKINTLGSTRVLTASFSAPIVTGQSAGAYSRLLLFSPSADLTSAANEAYLAVSDATNTATFIVDPTKFTFSGQPVISTNGTPANATLITTDAPHTVSYVNNWTALASGTDLKYELMNDGTVQVTGRLTNTAGFAAGSSQIASAVPSAYIPARDEPVSAWAHLTASPYTGVDGFVLIRASGLLDYFGAAFGASTDALEISGRYPLGF